MKKAIDVAAAFMVICALTVPPAFGNTTAAGRPATLPEGGEEGSESRGTEYVMRRFPGERLIPVRLLGGVRVPGTYYVPIGMDMVTLISLSGGVESNADTSKIIYSRANGKTTDTLDLRRALEKRAEYNPTFEANDVIYVEPKSPIVSSNTLLMLTVTATLLSIALGTNALIRSQ